MAPDTPAALTTASTISALPRVAENVLKRLRSPQCNMRDVAHDLSEDPVSAASVLRLDAVNRPVRFVDTDAIVGRGSGFADSGSGPEFFVTFVD